MKRSKTTILAAAVALAAAGCALEPPAPAPLPGAVRVIPLERRSYDAPPESNLFRLEFDAVRAGALARRAAVLAHERYDDDGAAAEVAALESDATRELKAQGKCSGLARLAAPASLRNGTAPVSAIFKCVPPVL
jgi:hypothetical protein